MSGASLAKTHDRTISIITAGVIGVGILLQIGAFFIDENKGGLMMYLAFALVSTGLLLSFLPSLDWVDSKDGRCRHCESRFSKRG